MLYFREVLSGFVTNFFPLRSDEFATHSRNYNEYIAALNKVREFTIITTVNIRTPHLRLAAVVLSGAERK